MPHHESPQKRIAVSTIEKLKKLSFAEPKGKNSMVPWLLCGFTKVKKSGLGRESRRLSSFAEVNPPDFVKRSSQPPNVVLCCILKNNGHFWKLLCRNEMPLIDGIFLYLYPNPLASAFSRFGLVKCRWMSIRTDPNNPFVAAGVAWNGKQGSPAFLLVDRCF